MKLGVGNIGGMRIGDGMGVYVIIIHYTHVQEKGKK